MTYTLQVIVCQAQSCRTEIVLPFGTPAENFPLVPLAGGDPYLDVACPGCGHVFRYTSAQSSQRVSDTSSPYQRPASAVWLRVWLKCDGTACNSRIQVESAMTPSAMDKPVNTIVSRWVVDDAVKCSFGHKAFQPPETIWAVIVSPDWPTMIPMIQDFPR